MDGHSAYFSVLIQTERGKSVVSWCFEGSRSSVSTTWYPCIRHHILVCHLYRVVGCEWGVFVLAFGNGLEWMDG